MTAPPRPAPPRRAAREAGYSLMELLIVLAILALLVGLAAPALYRQLEAAQEREALAAIEDGFRELPFLALSDGVNLVAPADASGQAPDFLLPFGPLEARDIGGAPEGWRIVFGSPVWVRFDGVCQGGEVAVVTPGGERLRYRLEPYTCAPRRIETPPGEAA